MTTYVEYKLDDDAVVLVEVEQIDDSGITKTSSDEAGNQIIKTAKRFDEALESAKASTILLLNELKDLPTDELEISFGLKTTGEAGIFAIGKVGVEVNYAVKVKWKRETQS